MDNPARAVPLQRNSNMQHLMKNQIFKNFKRNRFRIQALADGDGVVGRVVTAEDTARRARAPANPTGGKLRVEESAVQPRKNLLQIVTTATRGKQPNTPTRAPGLVNPAAHGGIVNIGHVTFSGFLRGAPAEKLREEDLRKSFQHDGGRFGKNV